jgi:hypothetical protein
MAVGGSERGNPTQLARLQHITVKHPAVFLDFLKHCVKLSYVPCDDWRVPCANLRLSIRLSQNQRLSPNILQLSESLTQMHSLQPQRLWVKP